MLNLGEVLYNKLPEIYRTRDAQIRPNPYPLKRFLKILGEGGFNEIEKYINAMNSMYDIDNCDPIFLKHIADTMGLQFPFDMDEQTQRRFLKVMPKIYKVKGTPQSFNYLAREMFGSYTEIKTHKQQYEEGMTPEEYRKLFVDIKIDGDTNHLHDKERNFRKFCELLRPVNTRLIVNLLLFYYDNYHFIDKVSSSYGLETLKFNPEIEVYGRELLVDGVNHYAKNSGIMLSADVNKAFRLNKNKLYAGQKIVHTTRMMDEMVYDLLKRTDGLDTYDSKRLNDFANNFILNQNPLLGAKRHLGFNGDRVVISTDAEDSFTKQLRDEIVGSFLRVPVDEDRLVREMFYINGERAEGSGILLRADIDNPFSLNKSKLYKDQTIEVKDRFQDEALSPSIKEDTGEDVSHIRGYDFSNVTFHLNSSKLNNLSTGLSLNENLDVITESPKEDTANLSMVDEGEKESIKEVNSAEEYDLNKTETASSTLTVTVTPSLLCGMTKLATSFYLTHFTPQKSNFAY